MARRKSRKMKTRRTPAKINLFGVAEAALIGNAVTQGMFNVDLRTFFLDKTGGTGSQAANLNQITLREIIQGVAGTGDYGTKAYIVTTTSKGKQGVTLGGTFGEAVKENLSNNGGRMIASLITIPIAFKVGSKLTRKPRAIVNKIGKMSGLPVRV